MLLLLLNYVVLRALWKIDVHLISTLVNKSLLLLLLLLLLLKPKVRVHQLNLRELTRVIHHMCTAIPQQYIYIINEYTVLYLVVGAKRSGCTK